MVYPREDHEDSVIEEVIQDEQPEERTEVPSQVIIDGQQHDGTSVYIDTPEGGGYTDPVLNDTWFWIRDSTGHGSVTVTLVTISFWVVTLIYVLSAFETIFGVNMRPFDAGAAAAYFVPILTLYGQRRWTEAKYIRSNEELPAARRRKKGNT